MIPSHLKYNLGNTSSLGCKLYTDIVGFSNKLHKETTQGFGQISRRIVAMDISPRRVGVAVSDDLREYAIPLGTIQFDSNINVSQKTVTNMMQLNRITKEIRSIKPNWIVGWPIGKLGNLNSSTDNVLKMLIVLNKMFCFDHVLLYDERYTTEMAKGDLVDRPNNSNMDLDSAAASRILQEFLDIHARNY
jgi:RNase H-fold protein (predicted Holliday junction resolvase)